MYHVFDAWKKFGRTIYPIKNSITMNHKSDN